MQAVGRLPGALAEPEERSDRDLIAAAKKGSHLAFEALVRRYSERAYRVAYRVVQDADAADEVLQEALIKAYWGLPRFEFRSTFYTWLYRIVINLALDRRRQAKRPPPSSGRMRWPSSWIRTLGRSLPHAGARYMSLCRRESRSYLPGSVRSCSCERSTTSRTQK